MRIAFEPGEVWWGGASASRAYPLRETDCYTENLIDASTSAGNQFMPLLVSSHGRYIWSDKPFILKAERGILDFSGAKAEIKKAGDCLREAYAAAQKAHFPCDGRLLPERFFSVSQLNTWMEFTYYVTQRGVLDFAREWTENGFTPGILIIDEGWQKRYGVWDFDRASFPDPAGMVRQLHEWGFTVLLWVVPYVSAEGPEFERSLHPLTGGDPEAEKRLYLRARDGRPAIFSWWNGYSAMLDMTDECNRSFLRGQLDRLIEEYGIDGFKFDGGSVRGYSPDLMINGDPGWEASAQELNRAWNEFGAEFEWHEFKDTYGRGGRNTVQRLRDKHPVWGKGGLADLIPCAINAGLMGFPFICPDMIGGGEWSYRFMPGFKADEELFVRMAQCSALFPMMQFSWAPWRALSAENLRLCLEAARLHERLAPRILRTVRESERTGEPVIRSLEYECPRRGFEGIVDEFMVGSDLLAAPVIEKGAEAREVAFPDGRWRAPDGTVYEGPARRTVRAPLDTLPWFERA